MTNELKLELTLCEMLPYGLNINFDNKINGVLVGYDSTNLFDLKVLEEFDNNTTIYKSWCINDTKPLLHSLDKLTEPIIEGGLIPIFELAKLAIGKECKLKDVYVEESGVIYTVDLNCKSHTIIKFHYATDCNSFYLTRNGKSSFVNNQLELFEKLKEWHFNLNDLPSEMYIEKSLTT